MPFRWTINPYRGCSHACTFCFARPTHKYLDFDAGRDFEREIVVKVNAPEVVRAELGRPSWKGEHVAMGTNTDPVPVGRVALQAHAGDLGGDARRAQPVLDPHEVAAAAARHRADEGDRGGRRTSTRTCRSRRSTRRRGARPSRTRRIRGRGWRRSPSSTARASRRGVLVAPLMPGHQRRARAGRAAARGGRARRARRASAGSRCTCAARCKGCSSTGCARTGPDLVERYEKLYARGAYAPPDERRRLARPAAQGDGIPPPSRFRGFDDPRPDRAAAADDEEVEQIRLLLSALAAYSKP